MILHYINQSCHSCLTKLVTYLAKYFQLYTDESILVQEQYQNYSTVCICDLTHKNVHNFIRTKENLTTACTSCVNHALCALQAKADIAMTSIATTVKKSPNIKLPKCESRRTRVSSGFITSTDHHGNVYNSDKI